jgi:hypothetical protein
MPIFTTEKALRSLQQTPVILKTLLQGVTQAQARKAIDGDDGWSVVEIVCHLRDMEVVFHTRALRMIEVEYPHLPNIDQDELVVKNDYAHQDMQKTLADFFKKRQVFVDWLKTLNDEQWKRRGVHAEYGEYSVTELAINTAIHDVNHIDQILNAMSN